MTLRRDKDREELEELAKRQYSDNIELKRAHIERKNKYRNLTRCLNDRRREEEEYSQDVQVKEHVALRQTEIEQEQQLGREINKIRRDEVMKEKERQLLRENCHELQELQKRLGAAYIFKEQMAQIAERESIRMQDKIIEQESNRILQSGWIKDNEFRTESMQKDTLQKAKYRKELQDQIILEEQNKRFQYEEFLREKKMLDDIVQRIHDENEREIEEKMCKMKKTQQEIDAFKAAQQAWKEKQKRQLAEEHRNIQEYLMSKASDAKTRKEAKARIEAAKAKICDDIAKKMYEVQKERREREEIISQLLEEEKKEELEKRHKAEVEKETRLRMDSLTSLKKQMEDHQEEIKKQAKEEAIYKEQLIAKIAEDERVEQLSNEKKRRKMLGIRKDVEQMILDRRQKKAEEMQLRMKILADDERAEEERKRLIQEERIRMLQEHAQNLIGYLPKGILTPEDLPYLGSDVVDRYGGKYKTNSNCDK